MKRCHCITGDVHAYLFAGRGGHVGRVGAGHAQHPAEQSAGHVDGQELPVAQAARLLRERLPRAAQVPPGTRTILVYCTVLGLSPSALFICTSACTLDR